MTNTVGSNKTIKDILDADYPAESLSEDARLMRQEMIEKINTYGKKVERYSEETVRDIWTDIFVNNLNDNEVAKKYGCTAKYSWHIRHNRTRKSLLKQFRSEYFSGLCTEEKAETKSDEATQVSSSENAVCDEKKGSLPVTWVNNENEADLTPEIEELIETESFEEY